MGAERPGYRLHLFVLRLWPERVDGAQVEWRGEIKSTATGEVRYFRHPASLYAALLTLLDSAGPDPPPDGPT